MPARPAIKVFDDAEALATAVADELVALTERRAERPFTVSLAGGSTPKRLYELLASERYLGRMPWQSVQFFFGDERPVPPDHPDSNYGMAHRALLHRVPSVAYRMEAEKDDADGYARLLGDHVAARRDGAPVLDLVLLGMGEDGHTASLFPGTAALAERRRWVVMNDVPQLATRRMTLTYPVLNAAERVWVLIAGAGKRPMVSECLAAAERDAQPPPRPILGVRPTAGELTWFLDRAAAGSDSQKGM